MPDQKIQERMENILDTIRIDIASKKLNIEKRGEKARGGRG